MDGQPGGRLVRFEMTDSVRAWNHVPVRIMDIRHVSMGPGEQQRYVFPSSVFGFTNQGEAVILLDGTGGTADHPQVIHGGKGAVLQVATLCHPLDYYLILYKPWTDTPFTEAIGDRPNPFQQKYAFPGGGPMGASVPAGAYVSAMEVRRRAGTDAGHRAFLSVRG